MIQMISENEGNVLIFRLNDLYYRFRTREAVEIKHVDLYLSDTHKCIMILNPRTCLSFKMKKIYSWTCIN